MGGVKIVTSNNAIRARVEGEIRLATYECGQTALTLVGTLEVDEVGGEALGAPSSQESGGLLRQKAKASKRSKAAGLLASEGRGQIFD